MFQCKSYTNKGHKLIAWVSGIKGIFLVCCCCCPEEKKKKNNCWFVIFLKSISRCLWSFSYLCPKMESNYSHTILFKQLLCIFQNTTGYTKWHTPMTPLSLAIPMTPNIASNSAYVKATTQNWSQASTLQKNWSVYS